MKEWVIKEKEAAGGVLKMPSDLQDLYFEFSGDSKFNYYHGLQSANLDLSFLTFFATISMGGKAAVATASAAAPSVWISGTSSSAALARALIAAGFARPANSSAHHIVAGTAARAAPARAVLNRFQIGVNEAANGVFVSTPIHVRMHTNVYYNAVNSAMASEFKKAGA
jgi:hypothetical protein